MSKGTFFTCRVHDVKKFKEMEFVGIFGVRYAKFQIDGFKIDSRLSPYKELLLTCKKFEKDGSWNQELFNSFYKPNFLSGLKNEEAYNALTEIQNHLNNGENVVFVCYCKHASMCHRSIIADFFKQRGFQTEVQ